MNKKIWFGTIGNTLEWFCYSLYGGFTANIATHFFDGNSEHVNMIFSYAIFSVGFLMRPIGSVIFGHIGDKVGRESLLFLSILLMTFSTFFIAFIPSFEKIGVLAPILLIAMRGLQGFAIGGEYTGAMVYLVEQAPSNKRGFYGSFSDFGCIFGTLLGGSLSLLLLTNYMSEKSFSDFGWKLPFLATCLIIPFAFYVKNMSTSEGQEKKSNDDFEKDELPIIEVFKKHYKNVIYVVATSGFSGVNFYTLLVFMPNYINVITNDTSIGFQSTLWANLAMLPAVLIAGFLSDKFGRKKVIIIGIIGVMILAYPLLATINNLSLNFFIAIMFGFFLGIYFGARAAFFAEAFPKKIRCTAVSVSLSVSLCVFAGTTPLFATYIAKISDVRFFCLYIVLVSILALYGFMNIKDRTGEKLL